MKKTNDYVDNKVLLQAIKDWQAKRLIDPNMPLCNTIGKAILDIATNLSHRWNFSQYTDDWKEKMVGDGIELSVKYIKNFDTDNYSNPHAYITTICFRAAQERIKREKKELIKKYKYFVEEVFDFDCSDMAATVDPAFYQDMINKIAEYEEQAVKPTKPVDSATETQSELDSNVGPEPGFGLGKIYGKDF